MNALSDTSPISRGRRAVWLVVAPLAVLAAACSGSSTAAETSDSSTSSSSTSSSTTSTTAPRQACTSPNLAAAAAGEYPGVVIQDVTCSTAAAVATIESGRLAGGVSVGFFTNNATDGAWTLVAVQPITSDFAEIPAGVPSGLPNGWRSKYDSRINRPISTSTTDVPPPTGTIPPETLPPPPPEPPVLDFPIEEPAPEPIPPEQAPAG